MGFYGDCFVPILYGIHGPVDENAVRSKCPGSLDLAVSESHIQFFPELVSESESGV